VSAYTDAQDHSLRFLATMGGGDVPFVWVQAENLALGGEITNVWLTTDQGRDLDRALAQGADCRLVDHTGDVLRVRAGADFTVFEVARTANEDEESATVPVVALTARIREVRALLAEAADKAAGLQRPTNQPLAAARVAAEDMFEVETGERRPMWRVIITDSESPTGIAPVCTAEGDVDLHLWANFGHGIERVNDGVWDCCPTPQFDTYSTVLAAYLVELLNADTAAGAS
jgi:CheY-like chemotaxis protein